ncbi:MAG: hypothetical protein IPG11_10500 [Flavobacteriales bacterium]|nr:hypothetical protein [Flavobacteriales bacterium]
MVTPERPLHVLEMDIKSKWITRDRRNGYILTILTLSHAKSCTGRRDCV